jgi:hypothetical protein
MPRLSLRPLAAVFSCLALTGFAAAAAEADDRDPIRDLLAGTEELAGLKDVVAKLNPIAGGLHYGVDIFGAKADLYVYFPDGPVAAPVAVLLLPSVALSTIIPPLKGTPMDVTLDYPIVIAGTGGYLHVDKMPAQVADRARKIGFTSAFHVDPKLNVIGRVADHGDGIHQVLRLINLNAPLVAGYSVQSGKKVDDPAKQSSGSTPSGKKDDDKITLKDRVISLSLPADATWNEPLFLKHTTIERASIQFRKPKKAELDPSSQLRINGRALIGAHAAKEYDLFFEKSFDPKADPASLGMLVALNPTGEVVLTDFFAVTQALWATLGFPQEMAEGVLKAGHALPLDQIKLRNPYAAKEAFPEEGGLPDFDKVMFAGANPAAKIPGRSPLFNKGPLLTVNADAKVFGFDAAGLSGAFSLAHGIKLDAKAKLPKLGPITVADASFDTTINLKTAFMKLHAEAAAVGKFDVDAGKDGLSFEISPQCPGKPVGLIASLSGFDLTKDFSVKPQMKDCLTPIVKDLIEDGEKAAKVAGEIAGEAADEAAGIAKAAAGEVADLAKKRAEAWGTAIGNKVGAGKALDDAKKAVDGLKSAVSGLEDQISSLTHSIDHLLRKAWAFVKGEVKGKKKERQHKIADRDQKRAELAAAKQREQQAERAAADVPVPYHDDSIRTAQAAELGKRAVVAQQTRFADQARGLPDDLKKPEVRQQLFKLDDVAAQSEAAFVAEQKALRAGAAPKKTPGVDPFHRQDPRQRAEPKIDDPTPGHLDLGDVGSALTLNDLIKSFGSLEAATQAPIPDGEAIAVGAVGRQLDAVKEKILREEVPQLPTMAFGQKVLVQAVVNGTTLCLTQRNPYDEDINYGLLLKACDGSAAQELVFRDTGVIEVPDTAIPAGWNRDWGKPCLGTSGPTLRLAGERICQKGEPTQWMEPATRFFYDPLDGMIRLGRVGCLDASGVETGRVSVLCPGSMTDEQIQTAKRRHDRVPPDSLPAWKLVNSEQFKKQRQQGHATTLAAGPLRGVAAGRQTETVETNLAPLSVD